MRTNRIKVYCPKCEEVYAASKKQTLDGAFFGASFSHVFIEKYKKSIVLPTKVYYYEPIIHGFKLAGKRGSKLFIPF